MGWGGYIRSYAVQGKLDYQRIKTVVEQSKNGKVLISAGRSPNYYLHQTHQTNPSTGKYEECYAYRMYATDILQYFADGTVHIVTYPSAITYSEINHFGPVRCWNDRRSKWREERRFGTGYPIPDGELSIDSEGYIIGPVVDTRKILDPAKAGERRRIYKAFREKALPRFVLGEFGDVWAFRQWDERQVDGWCAMLPNAGNLRDFANLIMSGGTHTNMHRIGEFLVEGPMAKSKEAAIRKACDLICKQGLLSGDEWYTEERVDYGWVKLL